MIAKDMVFDAEDMREAVNVLKKGGVILYPTDTVWGIGCDATNEQAVKRIFEIKQRDDSKAMLLLLDSQGRLRQYVKQVPDMAYDLIELATRPLTIIYPGAYALAPQLVAEDGSIGIRITEELFSKTLCMRLGRPLVSTSANISGEKTPQNYSEITKQIRDSVDYVVRYRRGDRRKAEPSQIIKLDEKNHFVIIRN
ncbi:MAG: threonylcarbamoyl-AMP synthase [Paludibacteraceae bacterium]|nr:threonylcarbamoyl-AMP synthase [Paludibacteraceae bacterium]